MTKLRVMEGEILYYPDGVERGRGGYVVDTATRHENHALAGQMHKMEPCPAVSGVDSIIATHFYAAPAAPAPEPTPKKKAKKKKRLLRRKKSD